MPVLENPRVLKAVFYKTGTYDDQVSTGYMSRGNHSGELTDIIAEITDEGCQITDSVLSEVANDIITYDLGDTTPIDIDNGWSERRFGFVLAILEDTHTRTRKIHVVTGYTNHCDITMISKELDPNMVMYINNSIVLREEEIDNSRGRRRHRKTIGNEQIIRGRRSRPSRGRLGLPGSDRRGDVGDTMIRPSDIFYRASSIDILARHGGAGNIRDGRSTFNDDIKTGQRRHNNLSSYLTDVLRTGIAARSVVGNNVLGEGDHQDRTAERIYQESQMSSEEYAAAALDTRQFHKSRLFSALVQRGDFDVNGSVTLEELTDCVDWPEGVTDVYDTNTVERRTGRRLGERGTSARWNDATNECLAATIISRSVPAMMLQNLISECQIIITNETLTGEIEVVVTNERPLVDGIDIDRCAENLEDQIRIDLARVVTRNNEMDLSANIDINMAFDQQIKISVDGGCEEEFIAPMFCDGLNSPQKSSDPNALGNLATDLEDVIIELSNVRTPRDYR